jgi:hypothetical protein
MKPLSAVDSARPRVVVIPPSVIEIPLREALREAAAIRVRDLVGVASGGDEGDPALIIRETIAPDDGERPVVILDAPERTCAWMARSLGLSEGRAVVATSQALASILEAVRAERAQIVRAEDFLFEPAPALHRLIRDLGLDVGPARLAAVCEAFVARMADACEVSRSLSATTVATQALSLLQDGALRPGARTWWDRSLFLWGDRQGEPCPPTLDVTGPVRVLFYGPYISLPAGEYRTHVEFEVSTDAARRSYLMEFGGPTSVSHLPFGPLAPGRHVVRLAHRFDVAAPAEVRLWVARAAFHGELALKGASIEVVVAAPPYPEA